MSQEQPTYVDGLLDATAALKAAHDAPPRTWSLPAEPGPEVKAVRDRYGRLCEPTDRRYAPRDHHHPDTGERIWRYWHADTEGWATLSWRVLVANYGPLTDATGEPS